MTEEELANEHRLEQEAFDRFKHNKKYARILTIAGLIGIAIIITTLLILG